jgi:hypothetical protein
VGHPRFEVELAGKEAGMSDQREDELDVRDPELLPPREALTLLNTDPSAYAGGLGGLLPADGGSDPSAGGADAATSAAGSTHDLADAQASGSDGATVSDQPQTVTTDSTQTASSQT